MKIKELIEALSLEDGEIEITVNTGDHNNVKSISYITKWEHPSSEDGDIIILNIE